MIDVAIIGAGIAGVTVLGRKNSAILSITSAVFAITYLTYFIAASRLHRKVSIKVFEASSGVIGQKLNFE